MIDGDKARTTARAERSISRQLAHQLIHGGRVGSTILELWQRTRMDWGFVTDRLSTVFRRERWIGSHERRFISETLYGLVRHLRRIDLAISLISRRTAPPRDLDRLLALLVLEGQIDPNDAAAASPALDWARCKNVDDAIAKERDLVKRVALAASLPDWLATKLCADWEQEAMPLALALNQRAPMTVRANSLIGDRTARGPRGHARQVVRQRAHHRDAHQPLRHQGIHPRRLRGARRGQPAARRAVGATAQRA
jgi:16S rRNA (cytosine967-C5)-methyltransferase